MSAVCLVLIVALFSLTSAEKYTVTDEVWFDVEVQNLYAKGKHYRGTFTIGVFGEIVPLTALNFVSLARGYKKMNDTLSYKNSRVHKIIRDLVIQMGDYTIGDGTGGRSIFGYHFNDENFNLSHRSAGWVSMANHGPDTNTSQFFILLGKARWLDGKHVVFGKVIRGFDVVQKIAETPTEQESGSPKRIIRVKDCGVHRNRKYDLPKILLDSTRDINVQ